jgi:hypothetical protein
MHCFVLFCNAEFLYNLVMPWFHVLKKLLFLLLYESFFIAVILNFKKTFTSNTSIIYGVHQSTIHCTAHSPTLGQKQGNPTKI